MKRLATDQWDNFKRTLAQNKKNYFAKHLKARASRQGHRKGREIGKNNQLISVTHLPQVAARGQYHFMIYKKVKDGVTSTFIKPLLAKDRVEEIAKLLSGKEVTETAKKNALELLNQ